MDSLLLSLKLLGLISSATFGILGTVHEFRTKAGTLTKWGKVAIIGTIVSACVAVVAQFLESRIQDISARAASLQALHSTQRVEKIVNELNRALQPIDSISAFVADIDIPMSDHRLSDYKRRLEAGIHDYLNLPHPNRLSQSGISTPLTTSRNGQDSIPLSVEVSESHLLFPSWQERLARAALELSVVEFAFYKTPIDARRYLPFHHTGPDIPDLRLINYKTRPFSILKSLERQDFKLTGSVEFDRKRWEDKTGHLISIPDLAGAQLLIAFGPIGISGLENDDFLSLRQQMSLNSLSIHVGARQRWIRSPMLKRHVNEKGQVFFEFIFPTDPTKLFSEG